MNNGMREVLSDQLAACRNDDSWFPPLNRALADLTAGEAAKHEGYSTKSVWALVNHLSFWNEQWLRRFNGEPVMKQIDNESTFNVGEVSAEAWEAAVIRLDTVLARWREALAGCPASKLYDAIPDYPEEAPWWGAVSNLCTHNAYHIGQIVSIRQRQGNWRTTP